MKPRWMTSTGRLVGVACLVLLGFLHSSWWPQIDREQIAKGLVEVFACLQKLRLRLGFFHRIAVLLGNVSKVPESSRVNLRCREILDGYRQLKKCATPVNLNRGGYTLVSGHE